MSKKGTSAVVLAIVGVIVLTAAPSSTQASDVPPDETIVAKLRLLTADEVRSADVTEQEDGVALLARLALAPDTAWVARRPTRVFRFGDQLIAVGAATPLAVYAGLNASGKVAYNVYPLAQPVASAAQAGFAGPPDGSAAWVYNTSDFFSNTYNGWQRNIGWTIMAAWNYRLCSNCTPYQYFRIYGQIQGGTIAGQNSTWRRLWLEFAASDTWGGSPTNFEIGQPAETVNGPSSTTITVGFGTRLSVTLGAAPLTATGGTDTTFSGTMSIPDEYWYPVLRSHFGSGGVGYCRRVDWNGTRKLSTRQALRQNVNAQLGYWSILYGMQQSYNGCPN